VERSFDLVQQLADVVQAETGAECAEIPRDHLKWPPPCGRARRGQSAAERVVHGVPERPVRLPRLRPQLRGHVLVEGQRRSHIMMLIIKHQDVKPASAVTIPAGGSVVAGSGVLGPGGAGLYWLRGIPAAADNSRHEHGRTCHGPPITRVLEEPAAGGAVGGRRIPAEAAWRNWRRTSTSSSGC